MTGLQKLMQRQVEPVMWQQQTQKLGPLCTLPAYQMGGRVEPAGTDPAC